VSIGPGRLVKYSFTGSEPDEKVAALDQTRTAVLARTMSQMTDNSDKSRYPFERPQLTITSVNVYLLTLSNH
jgi:hypothetical protein